MVDALIRVCVSVDGSLIIRESIADSAGDE
jgi:hypothetical protein